MRINNKLQQSQAAAQLASGSFGLSPISVEWKPVSRLRPAKRNARSHSERQINQIAEAIKTSGYMAPIVLDANGRIIAGHGRLAAAQRLGFSQVPTISLSHLSEVQARMLALADNKIAQNAGWDRELLAIELHELAIELPAIGLDLELTGFAPAEIDALQVDLGSEQPDPSDDVPELQSKRVVSRPGDLFVLGKHRLLVGDARNPKDYRLLMGGDTASMAFLDPPYNVPIDGNVSGHGKIKHGEFICASGEMSPEQFTAFLESCLLSCAEVSADGAIHFVCMDWRHIGELMAAGRVAYSELKNLCAWIKANAGQGSFYRSRHELVFVFKVGAGPHINTFGLGQHGRTRTNVWEYGGVNGFRAGRMDELRMHPTVKPVAMVVDAMRDCSRRGDVVLDAFAGSGTTIMAAEQIGRRAFCMEIDAAFADVCIRRWQAYTGKDAVLEATGETFDALTIARAYDAARPDSVGRAARGAVDSAANLGEPSARPLRPTCQRPRGSLGKSGLNRPAPRKAPTRTRRRS